MHDADGATAPETLRQKDRAAGTSGERRRARPPKGISRQHTLVRRRNSQVHGQMGHRRRFRQYRRPAMLNSIWTMSCHESPSSAPASPASRPLTPSPSAASTSPSSNVIAMRRWRRRSPTAASCRPAMPKSGTARPPCSKACAGCSRATRRSCMNPSPALAQVFVDGRIPARRSRTTARTRSRPCASRSPRASICFRYRRARRHRLRSGTARHPAHLSRHARTSTPPRKVNELLREGGLDRHAVDAERDRARSSPRCTASSMAASSRRPIRPATSTSSRADSPMPARATASSSATTRRSTSIAATARTRRFTHRRDDRRWRDRSGIAFDGIVVCAGVESREFAAMLGDHVNIYPVKGYSITVCLDDERSQHARAVGQPARRQREDRHEPARRRSLSRGGHGGDQRLQSRHPRGSRSRRSSTGRGVIFPQVIDRARDSVGGLRPMMPSMLPRVGQGKRRGRVLQHRAWASRLDACRPRRRSWWSGRLRLKRS